jgi:hypothetical protein
MCAHTGKFGRVFGPMYKFERYYTVYSNSNNNNNNNKHVSMAVERRPEGRNRNLYNSSTRSGVQTNHHVTKTLQTETVDADYVNYLMTH